MAAFTPITLKFKKGDSADEMWWLINDFELLPLIQPLSNRNAVEIWEAWTRLFILLRFRNKLQDASGA
jgi:hypothetical protein